MKQLGIFNRLFRSIICFVVLLALPGVTHAAFSLANAPSVNVTDKTVSITVRSTDVQSVFLFVGINGNAGSIQKKPVAFTTGALTQTVQFTALTANANYSTWISRQNTSGAYETVAQLGTFTTNSSTGGAQTTAPTTGTTTGTQTTAVTTATTETASECNDGADNDGDGKRDHYGVDINGDGTLDYEPDPACHSASAKVEYGDDVAEGSLIPCTNKCTFSDVMRLLNTVLTFVIKVLLIPLFIIVIMYLGFRYIKAQGNAVQMSAIKKTFGNLLIGILLLLCSWLIVTTLLRSIGYTDNLLFFETTQ